MMGNGKGGWDERKTPRLSLSWTSYPDSPTFFSPSAPKSCNMDACPTKSSFHARFYPPHWSPLRRCVILCIRCAGCTPTAAGRPGVPGCQSASSAASSSSSRGKIDKRGLHLFPGDGGTLAHATCAIRGKQPCHRHRNCVVLGPDGGILSFLPLCLYLLQDQIVTLTQVPTLDCVVRLPRRNFRRKKKVPPALNLNWQGAPRCNPPEVTHLFCRLILSDHQIIAQAGMGGFRFSHTGKTRYRICRRSPSVIQP